MLRGLYSAAAGMISQQRKHDTVSNNIGNMNTPGFKQSNVVTRAFPEMLIHLTNGGEGSSARKIGYLNTGVMAEETISLYVQGDLQETRNPSDVALVSNISVAGIEFDSSGKYVSPEGEVTYQPQAFFTLLNSNDEMRFTRNGKFTVNADGELVTGEGYRVVGDDLQPLFINQQINDISITSKGQLIDSITGLPILNGGAQPISLRISRIDNPNQMIREGNGNYRLAEGAEPAGVLEPDDQVQVAQGYIERANVDPAQSTVDLMAALRAYEANQKVIQFYDRSLDKAVNEVGRI